MDDINYILYIDMWVNDTVGVLEAILSERPKSGIVVPQNGIDAVDSFSQVQAVALASETIDLLAEYAPNTSTTELNGSLKDYSRSVDMDRAVSELEPSEIVGHACASLIETIMENLPNLIEAGFDKQDLLHQARNNGAIAILHEPTVDNLVLYFKFLARHYRDLDPNRARATFEEAVYIAERAVSVSEEGSIDQKRSLWHAKTIADRLVNKYKDNRAYLARARIQYTQGVITDKQSDVVYGSAEIFRIAVIKKDEELAVEALNKLSTITLDKGKENYKFLETLGKLDQFFSRRTIGEKLGIASQKLLTDYRQSTNLQFFTMDDSTLSAPDADVVKYEIVHRN